MKTIILTGATSGIGLAIFKTLISEGHRIHMISRNAEKMKELCVVENATFSCGDLKNTSDIQRTVLEAKEQLGSIDVLINNSGLGYFDSIEESNLEEWNEMVDVNIKGLMGMTHQSLPHLLSKKGQIVNITSVASHQVFPNNVVYCATKHAVMAFSKGLRLELGDRLRITNISPGAVNTDFINKTTNTALLSQYKEYFASSLNPSEVAKQVSWAINAPNEVLISEIIVRPNRPVQ